MFGRKRKRQPFDPRTDTGEKRPVYARVAAGDVNDKYSAYPSSGLTPRRLAQIFRAADEGDVREQMELFEEMEEKDPHLFSQMQTRKLAVTGLDWELQPFSDSEQDKQVADFVDRQLKSIDNLDDIFIDLLDAIGKGISVMEIVWGVDRTGADVIEDIRYVHQKKLLWDARTDELKICTMQFPAGVTLPKNKFVVHRYKAKSGHASRGGVFRVAAWMYLFKNYDVKDWVAFCEVFGMPLRLGKYNAAASEEDKAQLMRAIYSLGTDAAGIVPDSTVIEFIESNKTTSVEIYEKLARYCDEQISKAILGQTLTSDSGGGSYAQSKTHDEVRHDLTEADAKALAVTIRRDIIRPLVEYNFGQDVPLPFVTFDCEQTEDQKDTAEIFRTLVCDMGLAVPESHVYKKFNIPKPEAGEAVLKPRRGLTQPYMEGLSLNSLKDNLKDEPSDAQTEIDRMGDAAVSQSAGIFEQMMRPLLEATEAAPDLLTLREALKDEAAVRELYEKLESPELADLLHQVLYLSELIGRSE